MRLTELEPRFLKIIDERTWEHNATIHDDGIIFLCPECFRKNNGNVGTHSIVCWNQRVPQTENRTGPGRWDLYGTSFEDISFVGKTSSSVKIEGGCNAHFSVVNGEIIFN